MQQQNILKQLETAEALPTLPAVAIEVIRLMLLAGQRSDIAGLTITVADDVADYLNNKKRRELSRLEDDGQVTVQVLGAKGVSPEYVAIECRDSENREVKFSGV